MVKGWGAAVSAFCSDVHLHLRIHLSSSMVLCPHDMHRSHYGCRGEENPIERQVSGGFILASEVDSGHGTTMATHHSNAPKTVAACAHLHTLPLQYRSWVTKTAWAINPANQKIIVTASMARIAKGCAILGKKRGERVRKGMTRRAVQIPTKIRKLTRSGEA